MKLTKNVGKISIKLPNSVPASVRFLFLIFLCLNKLASPGEFHFCGWFFFFSDLVWWSGTKGLPLILHAILFTTCHVISYICCKNDQKEILQREHWSIARRGLSLLIYCGITKNATMQCKLSTAIILTTAFLVLLFIN